MKYFECESGSLLCGDVLEEMSTIPDKSVDCVITSPPYWQLRDYGYPEQWGLEPTYQEYLEHLWQFMGEVYRVLKDDGTVWINLGDTYGTKSGSMGTELNQPKFSDEANETLRFKQPISLHKCLLLIPHRFAIGCIDRGWILRNDIIWAKRNGMPESCRDRFSKKHEYFFFMVKKQKYYFDLDGIKDKVIHKNIKSATFGSLGGTGKKGLQYSGKKYIPPDGKNPGDVTDFWDIPTKPSKSKHYATYNSELIDKPIIAGCPEGGVILDPFAGSGSTLLGCVKNDINFIGIEMDSEYCEIAKNRIEHIEKSIERTQLTLDL